MSVSADDLLTATLPDVRPAEFAPLRAQQQPGPSARQYLLYDAAEHASLREQQATLLYFLDLAMVLGRTLVLPRCRLRPLLPDGSPAAEVDFVPWSELFDLDALTALHPAVPLDAFVASHGRLDWLTSAASADCVASAAASETPFNGLPGVRVLRSECGAPSSLTALRALSSHAAIAFAGRTDALDDAGRAARMRPHVRFERGVYAEAAAFASDRLGGERYVAVHWSAREPLHAPEDGDDGEAAPPPQSAHNVARHARRLMKRHGVRRAFLAAAHADRAELAQVVAKLQPVRYRPPAGAAAPQSLRALARRDHIELVLCAMADYFLGTRRSAYSAAVFDERVAVFGLDAATAAEMGDDHNATVAPSDGRRPRPVHLKDEL